MRPRAPQPRPKEALLAGLLLVMASLTAFGQSERRAVPTLAPTVPETTAPSPGATLPKPAAARPGSLAPAGGASAVTRPAAPQKQPAVEAAAARGLVLLPGQQIKLDLEGATNWFALDDRVVTLEGVNGRLWARGGIPGETQVHVFTDRGLRSYVIETLPSPALAAPPEELAGRLAPMRTGGVLSVVTVRAGATGQLQGTELRGDPTLAYSVSGTGAAAGGAWGTELQLQQRGRQVSLTSGTLAYSRGPWAFALGDTSASLGTFSAMSGLSFRGARAEYRSGALETGVFAGGLGAPGGGFTAPTLWVGGGSARLKLLDERVTVDATLVPFTGQVAGAERQGLISTAAIGVRPIAPVSLEARAAYAGGGVGFGGGAALSLGVVDAAASYEQYRKGFVVLPAAVVQSREDRAVAYAAVRPLSWAQVHGGVSWGAVGEGAERVDRGAAWRAGVRVDPSLGVRLTADVSSTPVGTAQPSKAPDVVRREALGGVQLGLGPNAELSFGGGASEERGPAGGLQRAVGSAALRARTFGAGAAFVSVGYARPLNAPSLEDAATAGLGFEWSSTHLTSRLAVGATHPVRAPSGEQPVPLNVGANVTFRPVPQHEVTASVAATVRLPVQSAPQTTAYLGYAFRFGDAVERRAFFPSLRSQTATGTVFVDADDDGQRDPGERPLRGVKVLLSDGRIAVTGADGAYRFADVGPGRRHVQIDAQSLPGELTGRVRFSTALPLQFDVDPETDLPSLDVGLATGLSLQGRVYDDLDRDGASGPKDRGIGGVKLTLTVGKTVFTARTDAFGAWAFTGLEEGEGALDIDRLSLPPDYELVTVPPVAVKISAAAAEPTAIVVRALRTIEGRLYEDRNKNGQWEYEEPTFDGVRIRANGAEATTDLDGRFLLRGLHPGDVKLGLSTRYELSLSYSLETPETTVTVPQTPARIVVNLLVVKNKAIQEAPGFLILNLPDGKLRAIEVDRVRFPLAAWVAALPLQPSDIRQLGKLSEQVLESPDMRLVVFAHAQTSGNPRGAVKRALKGGEALKRYLKAARMVPEKRVLVTVVDPLPGVEDPLGHIEVVLVRVVKAP